MEDQMKGSAAKATFNTMDAFWAENNNHNNYLKEGPMGAMEVCLGIWGRDKNGHGYCGECTNE